MRDVAAEVDHLGRATPVVACDVREAAERRELIRRTLAELLPIDILVNSAGIAMRRPAIETGTGA